MSQRIHNEISDIPTNSAFFWYTKLRYLKITLFADLANLTWNIVLIYLVFADKNIDAGTMYKVVLIMLTIGILPNTRMILKECVGAFPDF